MRVVCADPLAPKLHALFSEAFSEFSFACPESADEGELKRLTEDADVLLTRGREVTASTLAVAKALRLIHVLGRHPDRVDVEAARRAGVAVATMPHGGAMAVADHTLALMLAVARKIVPGHLGVVAGQHEQLGLSPARTSEWSFAFNWLRYPDVVEINRKTLGLIGFGEIGKEVARRARAFDMTVLYHQRRPLSAGWEERLGVRRASLEELLAQSDIVSLHAPHTPENEDLIGEEAIALMKETAFLVNTARGGLVDEAALARALVEKRLAGAGLDVFVEEPLPKGSPLTRLDNVVLAPHTGGGSGGGQKGHVRRVAENVRRFERGEPVLNLLESRA